MDNKGLSLQAEQMTRAVTNTLCRNMPGAEVSDPWGGGHDVWKVGGKLFAAIGVRGDGVALKTASIDDAIHLFDLFGWPKAPYFHRSWVHVPLDTAEDEMRYRIEISYGLVRTSLTKAARAALPPWPVETNRDTSQQ